MCLCVRVCVCDVCVLWSVIESMNKALFRQNDLSQAVLESKCVYVCVYERERALKKHLFKLNLKHTVRERSVKEKKNDRNEVRDNDRTQRIHVI